jgi:predicted SprT family Zn-dependent metalloprotease
MTEDKLIVQTISNSIKPSIEETERFILYLNNKFTLNIKDNLIITIQETSKNAKGYFMPLESPKHYEKGTETAQDNEITTITGKTTALNLICISSLYLKEKPYITIAHELAHYINHINNKKAKNNYHHKEFKKVAELLLLKVSKGKHGFNQTDETEEFNKMLIDFKINPNAFLIFQNSQDKAKKGSRNLLFICNCNTKIRTALNEDKPLKAICGYCNSPFIQKG